MKYARFNHYQEFDPYEAGRQCGYKEGYAACQKEQADEAKADAAALICDEDGCKKAVSCGWGPKEARRHTCHRHSQWFKEHKIEWTPPESKL